MRKFFSASLLAIVLFFGLSSVAEARTRVHGYTRKNGTYVAPHYRSNRDHSKLNNWSSKGNSNPYTGKKGYKNYYR
jgi:hypothetical protein